MPPVVFLGFLNPDRNRSNFDSKYGNLYRRSMLAQLHQKNQPRQTLVLTE
jgi:hypothetical protein